MPESILLWSVVTMFIFASIHGESVTSAVEASSESLRNTVITPLKRIHDALEPLEEMRDDLSSLVASNPALNTPDGCSSGLPRDCGELFKAGFVESGVYSIYLYSTGVPIPVLVFCDMETDGGGWLVFQRRRDGTLDFYRNWREYQMGFGNLTEEFWLGNEFLHIHTDMKAQELRVDLQDHEDKTVFAKYEEFFVGPSRSQFLLNISHYTGTAGNSLGYHNGAKFSTKDQDNDEYPNGNCVVSHHGPWWHRNCRHANLNGLYFRTGEHNSTTRSMIWYHWRGFHYSLKKTEMKIRPLDF